MKAILVVDIPDDYEEYGSGEWYIIGDDLKIVSEENGALTTYKYIDDDMAQLKPLPQKKEVKGDYYKQREIATVRNDLIDFDKGYNTCIDEILGEEE